MRPILLVLAIILIGVSAYILYGYITAPNFNFMPHGHCFQLRPEIMIPYVVGNFLASIGAVYVGSKILTYMNTKAKTSSYKPIFYLFMSFFFVCGVGHFLMVVNVWAGWYHLEAYISMCVGLSGTFTAYLLYRFWPQLMNERRVEELEEAYAVGLAQNEVFLDGLIVHNGKNILYVNDGFTRLFGYSEGEVLGSYYDELGLFPEDQKQMILDRIRRKVWGPYTTAIMNKNGNRVDVIVNAKAMKWKGQDARAVSFRDISELVYIKRQLQNKEYNESSLQEISSIRDSILQSLKEYKTNPIERLDQSPDSD